MKEWLNIGISQVHALLETDPDFKALIRQLENVQTGYLEAISALSDQQHEQIEHYIALCEELEYQKTVTAYYCGKQNR